MRDRDASQLSEQAASLPPEVKGLAWRERQLATTIYLNGPMTAQAVEARLSANLSNAAIRSMLVRLCRKGILTRRKRTLAHHPGARKIPFLYFPAIAKCMVRQRAIEQLACEHFDGSLVSVAQTILDLLNSDDLNALNKADKVDVRPDRSKDRFQVDIAA